MADKKITELQEIGQPNSNAMFPVVDFGVTKKVSYFNLIDNLPITTFVRSNSANWGGSQSSASFIINGNIALINTLNSTEYIVQWNDIEYQTDTVIIQPDGVTKNMIIKQVGTYLIDARYASYDLISVNNYMRIRLRGQANVPITTTSGGTLLRTLDEGLIGTDENGKATKKGTCIIRVTQVPYYLALTFLHTGGIALGGTAGYPVFENTLGTRPYFNVQKLA
jgi:hypothetical protein